MKSDSSQRNKNGSQRVPSASADSRWDIHADVIQRIQRRIDTNNHDHPKSGEDADSAQLWQEMSMDRIAVMLAELTSNTSAVISQFNRNPKSFDMDAFIEYLDDSTDQADRLADQITDFANFGKSSDGVADRTELSSGGLENWKREKP
jgi:Mg2+ and Co2+ transporter CorA